MLLIPDTSTAHVDPFYQVPTLTVICNVMDPMTRGFYSRDPRYIARKAEEALKDTGIADISYWGPELEHFVFDSASFDQNAHSGYYFIDSDEGIWNSGQPNSLDGGPNLAYRPRHKEGYFPVPPFDTLQDLRSDIEGSTRWTCSTHLRRRERLRSFPRPLLSGSVCPGLGRQWVVLAGRSLARASSGVLPGRG